MEAGGFDGDGGFSGSAPGRSGGDGGNRGSGFRGAGSLFESATDPLLEPLLGPPAQGLDLEEAVEALQRLQVVKNQCDARSALLIERIRNLTTDRLHARTPGGTTSHDTTVPGYRPISDSLADQLAATEIGCALRLPERSSRLLVDQAHLLCRSYTPTLACLAEGAITWRHAVTVIEQCVGLAPHTTATLEHALLPTAKDTTVLKTAHRARVLRANLDPDAHATRATTATAQRRLEVVPDADGMSWLNIYLPAEHATGIGHRITALARGLQTAGEERTLTQLRVDVFTDLLTHTCTTGPPRHRVNAHSTTSAGAAGTTGSFGAASPAGPGSPPGFPEVSEGWGPSQGYRGITAHVNITVPVLTLLGVDDAPADLEGYGPIPAHIARRLAAHAPSFTRILTHPETGAILSLGRTTYTVPADLKNWLRIRDKTCRHPGCTRTASSSEIDHTTPWAHGGPTNHDNLEHLCRSHHALKTAGHWRYTQPAPGTITATSPAGRSYTTHPDTIPA